MAVCIRVYRGQEALPSRKNKTILVWNCSKQTAAMPNHSNNPTASFTTKTRGMTHTGNSNSHWILHCEIRWLCMWHLAPWRHLLRTLLKEHSIFSRSGMLLTWRYKMLKSFNPNNQTILSRSLEYFTEQNNATSTKLLNYKVQASKCRTKQFTKILVFRVNDKLIDLNF